MTLGIRGTPKILLGVPLLPVAVNGFCLRHSAATTTSRGYFPDMFNELVWEIYFMVSRTHQAFYFSQTCLLNMSGKIFDTMGVPRGWYISQTGSSNFEIIYPPKGKVARGSLWNFAIFGSMFDNLGVSPTAAQRLRKRGHVLGAPSKICKYRGYEWQHRSFANSRETAELYPKIARFHRITLAE